MAMTTWKRFAFRTADRGVSGALEGFHKDFRSTFVEMALKRFLASEEGRSIVEFHSESRARRKGHVSGKLAPQRVKNSKKGPPIAVMQPIKEQTKSKLVLGNDTADSSVLSEKSAEKSAGADILGDF